MKNNNDLVNEWFKKADEDILTIENNLKAEKIPTSTVCFHSQQSAEKYLKGYLSYKEIEFEFVHDMEYLINLATENEKKFEELIEVVKKLDKYSVKIRYSYFYTPTLEEAKESYEMAVKIRDFVLSLLKGKM
ncbi:MAG: HEPN domain-containing protein [Elusimicrobia bacterium]|nr:HEPN domain-containing protein [Elusimicrobiota bacterium]